MKTIILLFVLFISKLSGATFLLHFAFDSNKVGQELSVQFETENFASPLWQFNTRNLDSFNFAVTKVDETILFQITDPIRTVFQAPFVLPVLGNIGIQTSLFGRDFSPDIYLNGETSFFHSVSEGETAMLNVLFVDHLLSGELQNFSMERGRFEVRIFAVPESTYSFVLICSVVLLQRRKSPRQRRGLFLSFSTFRRTFLEERDFIKNRKFFMKKRFSQKWTENKFVALTITNLSLHNLFVNI